jgi:serine/threonine protein kinase
MDLLCGCPEYCAPEMLSGKPYTAAIDVWSAGVILYALAVGELPFSGSTREETVDLVIESEPKYPEELSPQIRDLLSKILKKNPAERYSLAQIAGHSWMKMTRTMSLRDERPRGMAEPVPKSETPPKGFWQWFKTKIGKKRQA